LSLNNPSKLAQIQELEFIKQKFDVAGAAQETMFSRRWIAENIFGLSEEKLLRIQRQMFYDKKYEASLEKAFAEAGMPSPEAGGMPGGGAPPPMGGPPMGGPPPGGPADMPPEDAAAAADAPPEEPGPLLAAPPDAGAPSPSPEGGGDSPPPPAKRDDPPQWKGKKYEKVLYDDRPRGAKSRSSFYSGQPAGSKDLKSLGHGIYENLESTYNKEENKRSKRFNQLNGDKER